MLLLGYFFTSCRTVFRRPRYVVLTVVVAALLLVLLVYLQNLSLLKYVITTSGFSLFEKVRLFVLALGGFRTNFSVESQLIALLVALLAGINIAFLAFHMARRGAVQKATGVSGLSLVIGLLGIGCAACGSVILTTIIGIGASTALFGMLPFHGRELEFLSVLIMLASVLYSSKQIQEPVACNTTRQ